MAETIQRPPPASKTERLAAGGAVLMITAVILGLVGIVLVTFGQLLAAPLLVIAVVLGVIAKNKLKDYEPGRRSEPPPLA